MGYHFVFNINSSVNKMEFILSKRGSRKLCRNGYVYDKNKNFPNGNTYWECEERRSGNGCKAKITLDAGENFLRMTGDHTHAANPERIEAGSIRSSMKQEARLFPDGRTNNVIARNQ